MELQSNKNLFSWIFALPPSEMVLVTPQNEDQTRDFPDGTVCKSMPANGGDRGLIPGLGKILHAADQLSPCPTYSWDPALGPTSRNYGARVLQLVKPKSLEPVHPNEEYPPLAATGESLRESSKDPAQPKINKILEKHQAGPLEPV